MNDQPFKLERVPGAPVSDSDIIADLKRVAALSANGTVSQPFYRTNGTFDERNISRRFGSWNRALETAGLAISNEVNISDERLFENLLNLWQNYGRQPRRRELADAPSTISQSPYMRRFGSWQAALEAFVEFANSSEKQIDASGAPLVPLRQTGRDPSLRLRYHVLKRDRFACQSCGASPAITPGVTLHIDHVIPWSKGGETVLENLKTLCENCNLGKSNCV